MTSSIRTILQIPSKRIADLDEKELDDLMLELFHAQAFRCKSPIGDIIVNSKEKAGDEGCDGWTSTPQIPDEWLGNEDTCWQFKAKTAGQPGKLKKEVSKTIPSNTLKRGGRFVVVASASVGKKGENKRLAAVKEQATQAGLPTNKIKIIGSESLAVWCNLHPPIAVRWGGHPEGIWTFNDWAAQDVHQAEWQADEETHNIVSQIRTKLDFNTSENLHLHLQGAPGVGKTRLALEVCREALWNSTVVYFPQTSSPTLMQLLNSVHHQHDIQLMIVADEVQGDELTHLRDAIGRSEGRVKLLSIGHCKSPDPARIPSLNISPMKEKLASDVIKGWYPSMPREHCDFVVKFADGYMKLARLAADAVARNPTLDLLGLLREDAIRGFLDKMLGTADRSPLYVVAALYHVGWKDNLAIEGKSIAEHLGLDWNNVRVSIEEFHRNYGIAPEGGRYRYISPSPLAIHLAVEAWTIFPEKMRSLPDVLPNDSSRSEYDRRLESIASNPQAREFAKEQLLSFFQLDDFVDSGSVRRWSSLVGADPDEAATRILEILSKSSTNERLRISGTARRLLIGTLVRLAWSSSGFYYATKSLALLAEAENESWDNNATGEFVAKFLLYLGGTAASYTERLELIDEMIADGRPSFLKLAAMALAKSSESHHSRWEIGHIGVAPPEPEWQPRTYDEERDAVSESIKRLIAISETENPEAEDVLVQITQDFSMLLREAPLRSIITPFFLSVRDRYPTSRETIRRHISEIIQKEKRYWKEKKADDLLELEKFHDEFSDSSLAGRLLQLVGENPWIYETPPELKVLAEEIVASTDHLEPHWQWLTSGAASNAFNFGQSLAEVDTDAKLASVLPYLPNAGHDHRVLAGYVVITRRNHGDQWYEDWFKRTAHSNTPIALVFEIFFRCGAINSIADIITNLVLNEDVPEEILGQLSYGVWDKDLSAEKLHGILQALTKKHAAHIAVCILHNRLQKNPDETETWQPLALELATNPDLIRSSHMIAFHWKELAQLFVHTHAARIGTAIVNALLMIRDDSHWFLRNSEAESIFRISASTAPEAIWDAVKPIFDDKNTFSNFSVGLPKDFADSLPHEKVLEWIEESPSDNAVRILRLVSTEFTADNSLAVQIISRYGDNTDIGEALFSRYWTGDGWTGSTSKYWTKQGQGLQNIANTSTTPKLKRWARKYAKRLFEMSEKEKQKEEEEKLVGF